MYGRLPLGTSIGTRRIVCVSKERVESFTGLQVESSTIQYNYDNESVPIL